MKLYLAHSTAYDYFNDLYEPLKAAFSDLYEIVYPHDIHQDGVLTKDVIPSCDAVIAEVSWPSTGQGIELGWADLSGIPIICFYRTGSNVSAALRFISSTMLEYDTEEKMIKVLRSEIEKRAPRD